MRHTILTHARLATLTSSGQAYGLIEDGAIVISDGQIMWCGQTTDIPADYQTWDRINLDHRLVTPGLIDCHTHIVYGGNRANEFEQRLHGASYADIARAGGGIRSTVNATRQLDEDALLEQSLPRVDSLIRDGVTTLEIKSGYGLDMANEIKMLRVARKIQSQRPIRVYTTFLAAHAVPPEYDMQKDAYIDECVIPTLYKAAEAGLVDAVDGFCETIGFSTAQIARVFDVAKSLNLPVKLHAEQLSNQQGAALAADYGALSADHLEYIDETGVRAMAEAGTVAVMLPGAYYTLRDDMPPPIELFRTHNVPMAVATDNNPGSSPLSSLLMAMNMACTLFRLTPEEALRGVTCQGARALGITDCGYIRPGMRADLAVWDVNHPAELCYFIGQPLLHKRIFGGDV